MKIDCSNCRIEINRYCCGTNKKKIILAGTQINKDIQLLIQTSDVPAMETVQSACY